MALLRCFLISVLSLHAVAFATEPPLGPQKARWLLTRAGFAPSHAEAAEYATLTHRAAVDRLLAGVRTTAVTPAVCKDVMNR
jgi:hypothetical protein